MCTLSLQVIPPGMPPYVVVAARPQGNNESSKFISQVIESASQASSSHGASFLNFAVDGLSVESNDVRSAICNFLSGTGVA